MTASAGEVAARGAPTGPRCRADFHDRGHGSHGNPGVPFAHSSADVPPAGIATHWQHPSSRPHPPWPGWTQSSIPRPLDPS
ncbi:hypothetical protein N7494_002839 [Penicillium frequentans]|uniref:Uncharacterized protein n=1 Tax=Penicillium frequentans TaxID=3151616 RepID=A0AAD6D5J7_9EURO|nr:hypothetical protein N7494_002839 [Penicillium glabrum]